ncbi:conjugative transposon protein TraJ [Pontibacter actiniarum]|uniref:Conjugative transposon protein TraJ n=1 Tax=Pontibacter actiniarum TaxID=323450 RepID=A0A1X9YS93_9BACT|nr:conjugative transposon protein TraJ [Pontibacter actiniarum]ARS35737.1 conjugative transposon protein TraJ [Pontibacter actiniarum]
MKYWKHSLILLACALLLPGLLQAQGLSGETGSLHQVLEQLYGEMLPLCSGLMQVAQGIAGLGALWYIGSRVWRHIAQAEPIDFYPLLRPFALGLAIVLFPAVLDLLNGVLSPTVAATSAMVGDSDKAIAVLLQKREEALRGTAAWQMYVGEAGAGDRDRWYAYTHEEAPAGEGLVEGIGNDIRFAMEKASYSFRNSVKEWLSEVLRLLYEAAALCINTVRTFQLVVLAILGPLVFGLAVFDGFRHTLTVWSARYINVYLWLPVANIFGAILGKVQEMMLTLDLSQVEEAGETFFSPTDTAYLLFLVMGIVGYLTVPSVANYIVHASGGNTLLYKISNLFSATSQGTAQAVYAGAATAAGGVGSTAVAISHLGSWAGGAVSSPGSGQSPDAPSAFQHDRISGEK